MKTNYFNECENRFNSVKTTSENLRDLEQILADNGYKCNNDGRAYVAARMPQMFSRNFSLEKWMPILQYAEEVGGCKPGTVYQYKNAQGGISEAKVYSLYDLPDNMVNPYLVCFSGMMNAPYFCMEALRFYAKKHNQLLDLLCIGKGGNKGLYDPVFNREDGIMVEAEYQAYLNMFDFMAPYEYVHANEKVFYDKDTEGNYREICRFAREKGMDEITVILCSGNFSYDKRLLAEGMWQLQNEEFKDVKINLVLAHCPIFVRGHVPEARLSEILLGYVAASLGPLMKNLITLDGKTNIPETKRFPGYPAEIDHIERYLLPDTINADWEVFRELISEYSNMGWPDYQKILYGAEHKEAVTRIILSDLRARDCFTPESYDQEIIEDIWEYQSFIGAYDGSDFLKYLKNTPDEKYF